MEALLTLKFELEKRSARHEEDDLKRMKSLVEKIEKVSRMTDTTLPSWFMPDYEVKLQSKSFARGCLGSVYYGVWGKEPKVVVKRFCVDESGMDESIWLKIEKDMAVLFELEHPNIVELLGASHIGSPPYLICKDAVNGNLRSFLARSGSNKRQMWRLLYEAALGLHYLHQTGVVHGNLKLNNILVASNDRAVLSDFGLSTLQLCSTLSGTYVSGSSVRWRAPECIAHLPTMASDVYSLAMCIIEASTGLAPYGILSEKEVCDNVRRGVIPDKPDEIAGEEWGLVLLMTNVAPAKRVTLCYVVDKLKAFADRDKVAMLEAVGTCSSCCAAISPGSRFCSQCGVPFRSPTQNEFPPHRSIQLGTSSKSLPDSSVLFLLHVTQIGSVDDQEQGLMALYQTCLVSYRRKLVYDANGVSTFVELAKHGRTHFLRACALGLLSWAEIELKFPLKDLESLRELVGTATSDECNAIAANVRNINRESRTKALMHCACITEAENMGVLRKAGIIPLLIALLESDDDTQKLLSICALGQLAADVDSCETMTQLGAVDLLLSILGAWGDAQKEHSVWALSRLTVSTVCSKLIVEKGAIPLLVQSLHANSCAARFHGTCGLGNLVLVSKENRNAVIAHGAIPHLVELLQSDNARLKTRVVCTLANLTVDSTNRGLLVRAEVITAFVSLLQGGSEYHKGQATRALANLALDECHIDAVICAGAIPFIVNLLRSRSRNEAARALANLSFKSQSRNVIVNEGAIEPLVGLLRVGTDNIKELAARALANLTLDGDGRRAIANLEAIGLFVGQLVFGSATEKYHSARALANLAVDEEHHEEILRAGAAPHFVAMLKCDVDNLKNQAALAFANLTTSAESRSIIANADAVLPMVALLRDGKGSQRNHALRALANIAVDKCRVGIIKEAGAIPLFAELLRSGSKKQKYHAARAVRSMGAMGDSRGEITRSGAIAPLVELLRDGTANQKAEAVCALGTLALDGESRAVIIAERAVPGLIALVQDRSANQKIGSVQALDNLPDVEVIPRNERLKHLSARTLEKLCADPRGCSAIVSAGGIPIFMGLLRYGTDEQKEDAGRILCHLSGDEDKSHIFAGIIPELIELLDYNLAARDVNHTKIANEGGITPLVGIQRDGADDNKNDAARALGNLAIHNQANRAEMNSRGVDSLVQELCRNGQPSQRDTAAFALECMDECGPAPLKRMRCDT